ncbi:MAG: DivIVA domain-containing protein [Candidatus Nanopelagicales bacterium]
MALRPQDIENAKFDVRRLRGGYDIEQVDQFLDYLQAEITSLQSQIISTQSTASVAMLSEVSNQEPAEILGLAQQALKAANSEAERVVRDARARAASITSTVEAERKAIESEVQKLEAIETEYRRRLKDWLSGMLQDLDSANELTAAENDSLES